MTTHSEAIGALEQAQELKKVLDSLHVEILALFEERGALQLLRDAGDTEVDSWRYILSSTPEACRKIDKLVERLRLPVG